MAELTTLARPYAKAAFRFALDKGQLPQWAEMLSLATQVVGNTEMGAYLGRPQITAVQQADAVIRVCGDRLTAEGQNFIRQLAENKRLLLLPYITELYDLFRAEQEKAVDVEVLSAFELSADQSDKLAKALSKRLERDVTVAAKTDTSLIGGVVIRAGDLVIDASVRGKVAKLRDSLNS